jgi:hypothetical protein
MKTGVIRAFTILLACTLCQASDIPKKTDKPSTQSAQPTSTAPSLALSPAVIIVKAQPGASSTHIMTMTNLTNTRFKFVLEALDVVVVDGKRVFVPAGETDGGIARSAVFNPPVIEVDPGQAKQVQVTLTVPADPRVRAIIAIFHGQTALPGRGTLMFTGSLGTLITYTLSPGVDVRVSSPMVRPQTESANLTILEQMENDGTEPAIPKGTLAILKSSGELIGRVAIQPHRLLPGEKFDCAVEYPHSLRPGKYRAMMSIQHEGGIRTESIEFQVQ